MKSHGMLVPWLAITQTATRYTLTSPLQQIAFRRGFRGTLNPWLPMTRRNSPKVWDSRRFGRYHKSRHTKSALA